MGKRLFDSFYVTSTPATLNYLISCKNNKFWKQIWLVSRCQAASLTIYISDLTTETRLFTLYGSQTLFTGGTRDAIYTATSGGQKLVAHQGAGTTDLSWASSMNFGNYQNLTDYSYTGKLQEMIFFNTDQSTNRTGIENNINDHFDIYS
jgi:hypothetical protein